MGVRRVLITLALITCSILMNACGKQELSASNGEAMEAGKSMTMTIAGEEVPVIWENNDSVSELTELAKDGLEISMSMYGGFEQVGSIGTSLPRNDSQMTTSPGDIVLYSGNQIVIFYGSNSWAYTRLGKITGLNEKELEDMFGNGDVTICLGLN